MRAFLFSICMFAATVQRAQYFNLSYHDGNEKSYEAVSIGSALYFLEHSQKLNSCCSRDLNLVKVRDGGQIVFRKKLGAWGYADAPLLSLGPDNQFVIADGTLMQQCDTGPVDYSVIKVDTSGNVTWEKKLDRVVTQLHVLSDNSILLMIGGDFHKWNDQGILTQSLTPSTGQIFTISNYRNDSFLVNHLNGGNIYLRKFSNSLTASPDVTVATTFNKIAFLKDSSMITRSGGMIYRYNKEFQYISSSGSQVDSTEFSFQDFCVLNDSLYCAGLQFQGARAFYMLLDKGLVPIKTSTSNLTNTLPTAISVVKNRVNILSTGAKHNLLHPFIDLVQIDKLGTIDASFDVGLTSFSVTKAELNTSGYVLTDAVVMVKNFGTKTLNSFHINCKDPGGLHDCLGGLNKLFTQTLNPGDSIAVSTGTFYQPMNGAPSFSTLNMCLFTSVPGAQNDINMFNDRLCRLISVTGIHAQSVESTTSVFPNPGRESVSILSTAPINAIEILNTNGQVLSEKFTSGEYRINYTHNLGPGVYVIRIKSKDHVLTKKLIIE